MTTRAATSHLVRFHGPPASLEALVPSAAVHAGRARLTLPSFGLVGEAHCSEAGPGQCWVHARLPRQTPAGTYRGRLCFGDGEPLPVEVVVHLDFEVALVPIELTLQVASGQQTEHRFVVINQGNASMVVARDHAIGLVRVPAVAATDASPNRHALATARIEDAPIVIAPQAHQRFDATLRWPTNLEPDYTYTGTWKLVHQSVSVRVVVVGRGRAGHGEG